MLYERDKLFSMLEIPASVSSNNERWEAGMKNWLQDKAKEIQQVFKMLGASGFSLKSPAKYGC